jgi:hypothetical protein
VQLAGQLHEAQRGAMQVAEQEEKSPQVMLHVFPQVPIPPLPGFGGGVNDLVIGSFRSRSMEIEARARGPWEEAISVAESIRVTSYPARKASRLASVRTGPRPAAAAGGTGAGL